MTPERRGRRGLRLRERREISAERTYGTILRLTFGVSIVGAVAGIIGLVNMFAALGR